MVIVSEGVSDTLLSHMTTWEQTKDITIDQP